MRIFYIYAKRWSIVWFIIFALCLPFNPLLYALEISCILVGVGLVIGGVVYSTEDNIFANILAILFTLIVVTAGIFIGIPLYNYPSEAEHGGNMAFGVVICILGFLISAIKLIRQIADIIKYGKIINTD